MFGWVVTGLALLAGPVRALGQDVAAVQEMIDSGHLRRATAVVAAMPHGAAQSFLKSQLEIEDVAHRSEAVADAQAAVQAEPQNANYQCQLAQSAGARAQTAGMLERVKLLRILREASARGLQSDPRNMICLEFEAVFYDQAPGIVGGDKQKAVQYAQRLAAVDPARGKLELALLADGNQRGADADAFRLQAVAADPRSYDARVALANQYLRAKDYAHAEHEARTAITLNPANVGGYAAAAQSMAYQQKYDALDQMVAQAGRAVPDNPYPEYAAGRVLIETGHELPRAERMFRHYVAATPEIGTPGPAAAHWRLGQVIEKEARKADALAEYKEAVRLEPKFEPAKKDLDRLGKN